MCAFQLMVAQLCGSLIAWQSLNMVNFDYLCFVCGALYWCLATILKCGWEFARPPANLHSYPVMPFTCSNYFRLSTCLFTNHPDCEYEPNIQWPTLWSLDLDLVSCTKTISSLTLFKPLSGKFTHSVDVSASMLLCVMSQSVRWVGNNLDVNFYSKLLVAVGFGLSKHDPIQR